MCAEAPPGRILISQRAHAEAQDVFEVEHVTDLDLKGLHRLIAAFNGGRYWRPLRMT